MKHALLISLATTLLASSSYSLAVKKTATPAVIHFPISKRNASPAAETTFSHRRGKRGVLTQRLINSVGYDDHSLR